MMHYRIFLPDDDRTPVDIREVEEGIFVAIGRDERIISPDELEGLELNGGKLNVTAYKVTGGHHFTWNGKACVAENKSTYKKDFLRNLRFGMLAVGSITLLAWLYYIGLVVSLTDWTVPIYFWWIFIFPIVRLLFYFTAAAQLKNEETGMARAAMTTFMIFVGINLVGLLFAYHLHEELFPRRTLAFPPEISVIILFRTALVFYFGWGLRKINFTR